MDACVPEIRQVREAQSPMRITPIDEIKAIPRQDSVPRMNVAMVDGLEACFQGSQDLPTAIFGLEIAKRPEGIEFCIKQLVPCRIFAMGNGRLHGP